MPFADELIGANTARGLLRAVHVAAPSLPLVELRTAGSVLDGLSLRERSDALRDALLADVPGGYRELAALVRTAATQPAGAGELVGWMIWPVTAAIATAAVADGGPGAFSDALDLLADLSGRLTSEFALRILLDADLDTTLARAHEWTTSKDPDIRRLASEGTRPYLPWAPRVRALLERPGITVPVLDGLYRDDSEYVRRSVANHLNDLSRDQAAVALTAARRWIADPDRAAPENTVRLVTHGLRTLIKRGDAEALDLLGFRANGVDVTGPTLRATKVPFGGSLLFRGAFRNVGDTPARLAIDYVLHRRLANGRLAAKTYKLAQRNVAPGQTIQVDREHSFRPLTTRRYYPGVHAIEFQVNGAVSGRAEFDLLDPADHPTPTSSSRSQP